MTGLGTDKPLLISNAFALSAGDVMFRITEAPERSALGNADPDVIVTLRILGAPGVSNAAFTSTYSDPLGVCPADQVVFAVIVGLTEKPLISGLTEDTLAVAAIHGLRTRLIWEAALG